MTGAGRDMLAIDAGFELHQVRFVPGDGSVCREAGAERTGHRGAGPPFSRGGFVR